MGWAQSPSAKHSSRIEDLFIWKISEELKLSVKEEKSVSELISQLNQRKSLANEKIDGIIQKLAAVESEKEQRKYLKEYRTALVDYNKISTDEVDKVQKLLSSEKTAKYFVLKSDLSKKIRNLLAVPERAHEHSLDRVKVDKPSMGDPKIIEE